MHNMVRNIEQRSRVWRLNVKVDFLTVIMVNTCSKINDTLNALFTIFEAYMNVIQTVYSHSCNYITLFSSVLT